MRTKYETNKHLIKEEILKEHLEKYWGRNLFKLHYYQKIDFAVCVLDRITALCEVKHRYFKDSSKIQSIGLSLGKWMAGMDYVEKTGLPFVFVVRLNDGRDGDYCIIFEDTNNDYTFNIGGRIKTQRDAQDIEPMIQLPWDKFKYMGNLNVSGYEMESKDWISRENRYKLQSEQGL